MNFYVAIYFVFNRDEIYGNYFRLKIRINEKKNAFDTALLEKKIQICYVKAVFVVNNLKDITMEHHVAVMPYIFPFENSHLYFAQKLQLLPFLLLFFRDRDHIIILTSLFYLKVSKDRVEES